MTRTTIRLSDPELADRHAPELPDGNCTHPAVESAWREKCIREAAYYRSLHRPPGSANEVEDWLVAEQEIDRHRQANGEARNA